MNAATTEHPSTESFRNVIRLSREVALDRNGNHIGVADLLVAVMRTDNGNALKFIRELGGNTSELETTIAGASVSAESDSEVPSFEPPDGMPGGIRLTDEAEEVVQATFDEARKRGAISAGTEHLLLAVLRRNRDGVAAALIEHGITYDAVSAAIGGDFH